MIARDDSGKVANLQFGVTLSRVYSWGGPVGWRLRFMAGYYRLTFRF